MKESKKLVVLLTTLAVISSQALVACDNTGNNVSNQNSDTNTVTPTNTSTNTVVPSESYTVTFKDGENVIYTTTGKTGDFVDIPDDLVSNDERISFKGWEGLDEADYTAGKVEIFGEDLTYNAKWYEMFGTNKTFSATKVLSSMNVNVDGVMDEAYQQATAIPVNTVVGGESDTTANVYFMWDDTYFYVFADVKDSTVIGRDASYDGEQWIEHNDTFEMWIDLLHEDSKAAADWNGGWGGGYRGEPGPMCEAHFKLNAGYTPTESERFGAGSEAVWDGWWSNEAGNDGESVGYSKITDTGYTVEYRVKATLSQIPEDLRLKAGEEIGVGIKIFDKTSADAEGEGKNSPAPNVIAMEAINGNMSGPKKLSNVQVVANPLENKTVLNVKQVRDCYNVVVDNTEDLLYKDAITTNFGTSTAKMLWDKEKVYVYATLGENAEYLKFASPLLSEDINITNGVNEFTISTNEEFTLGSIADLSVSYKESAEEVTEDCVLKLQANDSNTTPSRKMYESKKLTSGTIEVDGIKDQAYSESQEIDISTVSLVEAASPTTTGKAWIRWDDTYLYVFVDVKDDSVNTATVGDPWNNDGVEFWLSTCRTLPTSSTGWGGPNRPKDDYCGEGGWRVWAGNIGSLSGQHWMYDWADGCPREYASVLTATGYTVEYKLHLSAFAGEAEKEGQIIDFMININDGANGTRNGIVSTNTLGHLAYDKPYVLEHLRLVA